MIVPNKVIPYEASLLSKLPIVLDCLEQPVSPDSLYERVRGNFENVHQFVLCLDMLFILKRIDLDGGVLELC